MHMAKRGGRTSTKRVATRMSEVEEVRRMFEMRLMGVSLATIGAAFGYSNFKVHSLLEKYTRAELIPYIEPYREMQRERAELLWRKLLESGRLEKGDPAAFNAGVNILKRMAANDGSDAPMQIDVTARVDPKEIELHKMILEAKREARRQIQAIKGSVEEDPEDEEDDLEDDPGE